MSLVFVTQPNEAATTPKISTGYQIIKVAF